MAAGQSRSEYLKQWREARKARPAVVTVTEKLCTKCGLVKPASEFYKMPELKSGLRSDCKKCVSAIQQALVNKHGSWASRNQERFNARERRRHAQNPERRNAITRRWQEANRNYFVEWAKNNPDKVKSADVRHRKTAKRRAFLHHRRALLRTAEGSFSAQEWHDLCDLFGNLCLRCGLSAELTVDHIVPISRGGTNFITNIQPLCKTCNAKKGAKTIDYRPKEIAA